MASKGSIIGVLALFGVAAFAAYAYVGKKIKALKITFNSVSNKIVFDFPNLTIPISINITNPGPDNLTFQSLVADVLVNGQKSTAININTTIQLPAGKTILIKNLLLQTSIVDAATDILTAVNTKKVNVKIQGIMKADNMNFPVDETLNLI